MIKRTLQFQGLNKKSCFLWGPRQVGKSTLLKELFAHRPSFNLLDPQLFAQMTREPSALKERLLALQPGSGPIIIDEVQKVPQLLDVVQLMMDDHQMQFILSGSSARKLKRGGGNLLGGRALRYNLFPLTSHEIPAFDLLRAINHGLFPRHYLDDDPSGLIAAYVGDYLKEEVFAEALTRNHQAFSQFLEVAAFSNGEIVNFSNIARECGVRSVTVREYFQILEDTLIGYFVPAFRWKPKRRVLHAPKFYLCDVGLANHLRRRGRIAPGSDLFGQAFEHFLLMELIAHRHYSRLDHPISSWRTTSGIKVDFVLGQAQVAIEIKGSAHVLSHHLQGLNAFREEYRPQASIVVSREAAPRLVNGIQVLPYTHFLEKLWEGRIIA